jgi:hypothetical protein
MKTRPTLKLLLHYRPEGQRCIERYKRRWKIEYNDYHYLPRNKITFSGT